MLKLRNYNIILPKHLEIVKKKGSSLIFSALGGKDKEKKEKAAEKFRRPKGGRGGTILKFNMVDLRGLEPLTSSMPLRRYYQLSYRPKLKFVLFFIY